MRGDTSQWKSTMVTIKRMGLATTSKVDAIRAAMGLP